jgi:hypothetical protein
MAILKNFCHLPFRELYIGHNPRYEIVNNERFRVNDKILSNNNTETTITTDGYRSCCDQQKSYKGTLFDKTTDWFANDSQLNKTREQFLNNIRPSNCSECWEQEDNNIESRRQRENEKYENIFRDAQPTDIPELETLSIFFNSLISVNNVYKFIIENKSIRELKFASSNMLEIEDLLDKLVKANRTNLWLWIPTDSTTIKDSILKMLKKFDRVEVCYRIDEEEQKHDWGIEGIESE